jgi:hypothetical protein
MILPLLTPPLDPTINQSSNCLKEWVLRVIWIPEEVIKEIV